MTVAVDFQNVDIVFGKEQRAALDMIDRGASRDEILAATGSVLGCAGANLTVETGEICVLMGLSGSGTCRRAARCWSGTASAWSTW
jgi:glycine betaine/proline transport system ATP-binding protein